MDVATSKYDVALAVVENSLSQMNEESVVRLYDVGRIKAEEEDYDDAENDEENEDEGQLGCLLILRFWVRFLLPPNFFRITFCSN